MINKFTGTTVALFLKNDNMPGKKFPPAPDEMPKPDPGPELTPTHLPETTPVPEEPNIEVPNENPLPEIPEEVPDYPDESIATET